jgi:hypothetical protein
MSRNMSALTDIKLFIFIHSSYLYPIQLMSRRKKKQLISATEDIYAAEILIIHYSISNLYQVHLVCFNYSGILFRKVCKFMLKWKKLLTFNTVELYLAQIVNISCSGCPSSKDSQYGLFTFITAYSVLVYIMNI